MKNDNIVDNYCNDMVSQMFQEIRYLKNFLQKLRPIMLSEPGSVWQKCSKIEVLYFLDDDRPTYQHRFFIEFQLYRKLSSNRIKLPILVHNLVHLKRALGLFDPTDVVTQRTKAFLTDISLQLLCDYRSLLTQNLTNSLHYSFASDPWVDENDEWDAISQTLKAESINRTEELIRENLNLFFSLFSKLPFSFHPDYINRKIHICIWDLSNLLQDIPKTDSKSTLFFLTQYVLRPKFQMVPTFLTKFVLRVCIRKLKIYFKKDSFTWEPLICAMTDLCEKKFKGIAKRCIVRDYQRHFRQSQK